MEFKEAVGAVIDMVHSTEELTNGEMADNEARAMDALVRFRDSPRIVCLCGSTRFMDAFLSEGWRLTLEGAIVLSVQVTKSGPSHHAAEALGDGVAEKLDELHLRKIDLADEVRIINVGGYLGDSTKAEIDYAIERGKPITWLEVRL